jgi:hypothetical protein
MPSPFPGMDPYLEHPGRWPDVHHRLISIASDVLAEQLRPKHLVRIAERVYRSDEYGLVEDEIREARLEIIDRESRSVVTVIEFLRPPNKIPHSPGEISYREKRLEVMHSPSHVVEVDLLRSGTGIEVQGLLPPHDYLVHESSVDDLPKGRIWAIPLECPLPKVEIPLRGTDPAAVLDLQQVVNAAYDLGDYDLDIDYHVEPVPPLSPDKAEWPDRLLKSKKLR